MSEVRLSISEDVPGDAAVKQQYLQQIATNCEIATLRILADLSNRKTANAKIQKNEKTLKAFL